MVLAVTPVYDNPQAPSVQAVSYYPDQLIAGVYPLVTENGTVSTQVAALKRGTIMGQITLGAATAVAAGGNTGNTTSSAVTRVGGNTKTGVYRVVWLTATTFSVFDPTGVRLQDGANGVAYSDQIAFTMTTGGTPMVAGDSFNITVAAGSGNYIPSIATAVDGSNVPVSVLVDYTDATGGAVIAGMYLSGEFNQNAITIDASWSIATIKPLLRNKNIYLKDSLSATDPT